MRHNTEFIIKPADKASAIGIMDKANYIKQSQRQLSDADFYVPKYTDLTSYIIQRMNLHAHDMLQRDQIAEKTCSYLTTDLDRTQQFYMQPKIHMNAHNPPGRPIVTGTQGSIETISQFWTTS